MRASVIDKNRRLFPVTMQPANTATWTASGEHPVILCDALNEGGRFTFNIPENFSELVEAKIICIGGANKVNFNVGIYAQYGKTGEGSAIHDRWNLTFNIPQMENGKFFEVDLSSMLNLLEAGDHLVINVECRNGADFFRVHSAFIRIKIT